MTDLATSRPELSSTGSHKSNRLSNASIQSTKNSPGRTDGSKTDDGEISTNKKTKSSKGFSNTLSRSMSYSSGSPKKIRQHRKRVYSNVFEPSAERSAKRDRRVSSETFAPLQAKADNRTSPPLQEEQAHSNSSNGGSGNTVNRRSAVLFNKKPKHNTIHKQNSENSRTFDSAVKVENAGALSDSVTGVTKHGVPTTRRNSDSEQKNRSVPFKKHIAVRKSGSNGNPRDSSGSSEKNSREESSLTNGFLANKGILHILHIYLIVNCQVL